jgi:hypothetical protein
MAALTVTAGQIKRMAEILDRRASIDEVELAELEAAGEVTGMLLVTAKMPHGQYVLSARDDAFVKGGHALQVEP